MRPSSTVACVCITAALLSAVPGSPTCAQNAAPAAPPPDMVLVPAGEFTMGSSGKALDEDKTEAPENKLTLPDFFIDKCEVTTAQYVQFLNAVKATKDAAGHEYLGLPQYLAIEQANGEWKPKAGKEKFPIANVTWYGATAYAQWAGKRLPTEAEWEKAARGPDGRKFPWGPDMDYKKLCFGQDKTVAIGSFPDGASPCGCLDMAGNVWEWTSSLFMPLPYVATDGREDANSAERRVAKGGSWTGEPHIAHAAARFRPFPDFAHTYLGFRCAKSAQ